MESRTCSLCGEDKAADRYPQLRGRINGRRCNACLARLRRDERAVRPPRPPRLTEKDRTSKRCNVCMTEKPVSEFYWNERRWTSACRECYKAAQRARQAIAPEVHRAKVRARPSSQPEAQRAWREANKEHLAAYHKAWREAKEQRNPRPRKPRPRGYPRGYTPHPDTIEKRRATLAQRTEDERRRTSEKLSAAKRSMWESFSPEQRQSILDRGVRAGTRAFWEGKTWEERLAATAKMRHAGKNSYNTSIERAVGAVLSELGEPHEPQKRLADLRVDFYLPARNLVIECDGTYWHSKPGAAEKDAKRDVRLQASGYRVVRLPEGDIRRDARAAVMAALGIETR
jgi:very-short-patch-repair endonuclease